MGIYIGTQHTVTRRINYLYQCSNYGQAVAQSTFVFGSAVYDDTKARAKTAQVQALGRSSKNGSKALAKVTEGKYQALVY